jgi:hypothetical protein
MPGTVPPPPDPAAIRQGGDTIGTAIVIPYQPYADSGTTAGYTDDYDEACPYDGSTSPDVVYLFTPVYQECLHFDLLGSLYDTKIYIYDSELNLVACNDDFYPDYVSRIETAMMLPDETYAIVIDGYGGDYGEYQLNLYSYVPGCEVSCPPGSVDEGEPPLENGVPDTYNSGCDGSTTDPAIVPLIGDSSGYLPLCGRMGWITIDDEVVQDIDWFSLTVGASGVIDGIGDAAPQVDVTVMRPGGCDGMEVLQSFTLGPCLETAFQVTGEPGEELLLRISGPEMSPPCGGGTPSEFEYYLHMDGLQGTVAVKEMSLSTVKGIFAPGGSN